MKKISKIIIVLTIVVTIVASTCISVFASNTSCIEHVGYGDDQFCDICGKYVCAGCEDLDNDHYCDFCGSLSLSCELIIKDLQAIIDNLTNLNQNLTEQNNSLSNENQQLELDKSNLTEQNNLLSNENQQLKTDNSNLTDQNLMLNNNYSALQGEVDGYIKQRDEAREGLANSNAVLNLFQGIYEGVNGVLQTLFNLDVFGFNFGSIVALFLIAVVVLFVIKLFI